MKPLQAAKDYVYNNLKYIQKKFSSSIQNHPAVEKRIHSTQGHMNSSHQQESFQTHHGALKANWKYIRGNTFTENYLETHLQNDIPISNFIN